MSRPFLWFVVVSLIWGSTFAAARLGLDDVPPVFFAAVRYLIVAILLAPIVRSLRPAFSRGRGVRTAISALLAITAAYGLLFWGMRSTPSGLAGLVNLSIIPVGLSALAIATGEETPSWRLAGALFLGLAGLVGLYWTRTGTAGATGTGLFAVIVGTLCYCAGSVVARPLLRDLDALTLTCAHALVGGTALAVVSLATEEIDAATFATLAGWRPLVSLVVLVGGGTIVAYTLHLRLLVEWGTVRAGLYAFVSPIVALVIGHHLFGEPIGLVEIGGACLLLTAAALATFGRRPPAAATISPRDPRPGSPCRN